ncbi:MAG: carboxyltransferase domain-containing protein [Myxococcales bacterium]
MRHLADGAILAAHPDLPDAAANRLSRALAAALSRDGPPWLLEAIPAARTLLVLFDPERIAHGDVEDLLRRPAAASREPAPRTVHLPTCYDGPDLEDLARGAGLSSSDLIRLHSRAEHRVAFLGFAPGFPYMTGAPRELSVPRLQSPRVRVPARSVAVADGYTGIYPEDSAGGWRLIGRVAATLFDPAATPSSLLLPGDRAVFEPIGPAELAALAAAPNPPAIDVAVPFLRCVKPGAFTTVQGGPRYGLGALGVGAGGAMDLASLAAANALVGNPPFAAALELTIAGPQLLFLDGATFALAGADAEARLDGAALAGGRPHRADAGARLSIGAVRGGARVYLAFGGGLAFPPRGTPARPLRTGDVIAKAREPPPFPFAPPPPPYAPACGLRDWRRCEPAPPPAPRGDTVELRALPGPQWDFFTERGRETFFSALYRTSPHSDRRGLRLEGPRVELSRPSDIPPEGTAPGSVQVPGAGLPIVLGPDRPVTGGYAKIATVISADLPLLAQARPGTIIRFSPATLEEALAARRDAR